MRTSLWFVPALMVSGALGLAAATSFIEGLIPDGWGSGLPLVFSGRAVGARAVLSTIATATIGVAGVVFSMTIVSLQLASSQFGPRLLRTFLRDRGNQVVLGTFLGTFVYCLVVLPTVDTSGESDFVPHIAVTIAVLLAIASLAMLVYYIDHIAQSIHADAVLQSVGDELESVIDQLFPERVGGGGDEPADEHEAPLCQGEPVTMISDRSGYVRFINGDTLLALAEEHDLFVRVVLRPGEFAMHGECLVEVWHAAPMPDSAHAAIKSCFLLGAHRTTLQDMLFTFEQVSEIAMRAMSPGINDPTTAVHCVDRIGAGITRLVDRDMPSKWRTDSEGVVRIQIDPAELSEILEATVIAVSRTASVHLPVWLRLIEVLQIASRWAKRAADVAVLSACARRLAEHGDSELGCAGDRERLRVAATWASGTG